MRTFRPAKLAFALAGLMALAGVGGVPTGSRTAAAQTQAATIWAELHATRPAVGCVVRLGVEVLADGAVVVGTDVSALVSIDGSVVASDGGTTGGDGIVYLGVDTSAAYDGAFGWVDVEVGGAYVGGLEFAATADGACEGESTSFSTEAEIWAGSGAVAADGSGDGSAGSGAVGGPIWVPTHSQERNLSCEYAALQIATGAFGGAVPESWFIDAVGWSENPHWGYRGNIDGAWGNTDDYGVYAEPLAWALPQFGYYGEVFYGQGDIGALTARLDQGRPTLVWIGMWGNTTFTGYTAEGDPYALTPGMHVVVAYAYDAGGVYVSDPATASYNYYSWDEFLWLWSALDGMSLAVAPS